MTHAQGQAIILLLVALLCILIGLFIAMAMILHVLLARHDGR